MWSVGVSFIINQNKLSSKHLSRRLFETSRRSCDVTLNLRLMDRYRRCLCCIRSFLRVTGSKCIAGISFIMDIWPGYLIMNAARIMWWIITFRPFYTSALWITVAYIFLKLPALYEIPYMPLKYPTTLKRKCCHFYEIFVHICEIY